MNFIKPVLFTTIITPILTSVVLISPSAQANLEVCSQVYIDYFRGSGQKSSGREALEYVDSIAKAFGMPGAVMFSGFSYGEDLPPENEQNRYFLPKPSVVQSNSVDSSEYQHEPLLPSEGWWSTELEQVYPPSPNGNYLEDSMKRVTAWQEKRESIVDQIDVRKKWLKNHGVVFEEADENDYKAMSMDNLAEILSVEQLSVNPAVTTYTGKLINRFNQCPSSKTITAGYSQGAWVVHNSLVEARKIEPYLNNSILAVHLFGEPTLKLPEGEVKNKAYQGIKIPEACSPDSYTNLSSYRAHVPECSTHEGQFFTYWANAGLYEYQLDSMFPNKVHSYCGFFDAICGSIPKDSSNNIPKPIAYGLSQSS